MSVIHSIHNVLLIQLFNFNQCIYIKFSWLQNYQRQIFKKKDAMSSLNKATTTVITVCLQCDFASDSTQCLEVCESAQSPRCTKCNVNFTDDNSVVIQATSAFEYNNDQLARARIKTSWILYNALVRESAECKTDALTQCLTELNSENLSNYLDPIHLHADFRHPLPTNTTTQYNNLLVNVIGASNLQLAQQIIQLCPVLREHKQFLDPKILKIDFHEISEQTHILLSHLKEHSRQLLTPCECLQYVLGKLEYFQLLTPDSFLIQQNIAIAKSLLSMSTMSTSNNHEANKLQTPESININHVAVPPEIRGPEIYDDEDSSSGYDSDFKPVGVKRVQRIQNALNHCATSRLPRSSFPLERKYPKIGCLSDTEDDMNTDGLTYFFDERKQNLNTRLNRPNRLDLWSDKYRQSRNDDIDSPDSRRDFSTMQPDRYYNDIRNELLGKGDVRGMFNKSTLKTRRPESKQTALLIASLETIDLRPIHYRHLRSSYASGLRACKQHDCFNTNSKTWQQVMFQSVLTAAHLDLFLTFQLEKFCHEFAQPNSNSQDQKQFDYYLEKPERLAEFDEFWKIISELPTQINHDQLPHIVELQSVVPTVCLDKNEKESNKRDHDLKVSVPNVVQSSHELWLNNNWVPTIAQNDILTCPIIWHHHVATRTQLQNNHDIVYKILVTMRNMYVVNAAIPKFKQVSDLLVPSTTERLLITQPISTFVDDELGVALAMSASTSSTPSSGADMQILKLPLPVIDTKENCTRFANENKGLSIAAVNEKKQLSLAAIKPLSIELVDTGKSLSIDDVETRFDDCATNWPTRQDWLARTNMRDTASPENVFNLHDFHSPRPKLLTEEEWTESLTNTDTNYFDIDLDKI